MDTFNIRIGGEAGQGVVSVGNIMLRALAREGWELFAHQDYESRIRGGHNFFQIRLADRSIGCWKREIDVLAALDHQIVPVAPGELRQGGVVIYDPDVLGTKADALADRPNYLALPARRIVEQLGLPRIVANVVAAGAIWALVSEDLTVLEQTLVAMFAGKGEQIVAGNKQAARAGFELASSLAAGRAKPAKPPQRVPRLLLKGNDALSLGALAADLKFMSAYPMTPATGITEFIAGRAAQADVVLEQTEDEIAAINMAIGASFAGVRAMTATSGGGFALMTEALSFSGSAEVPIVVIDAQRPGPSTGLPTRTEQGDLRFAVAMSFGDFPRAVLAPGDLGEAFYLMTTAFNLADLYQMPVVVLSDQHLADSFGTISPFELDKVVINRGKLVEADKAKDDYLRHQFTADGISPRLYPGFGRGVVVSAGDEHDEAGHLIEDGRARENMMEKRMAKQKLVESEALEPVLCGSVEPDAVLIGFGSTKGAIAEAVQVLNGEGCKVQGIHLPQVFPLPAGLGAILDSAKRTFVVESNYSGQLEDLLAARFCFRPTGSIRRFDGRPINAQYILDKLKGGACFGK